MIGKDTTVHRLKVGDVIEVKGIPFVIHDNRDASGGVVSFEPDAYLCAGCGRNDVDDRGSFCPGCVTRAMYAVVMRDALQHLIDNDDEISAVIDYDNEQRREMPRGMPYVDLHDAGWDDMRAMDENDTWDAIKGIARAVHAVVRSGVLVDRVS